MLVTRKVKFVTLQVDCKSNVQNYLQLKTTTTHVQKTINANLCWAIKLRVMTTNATATTRFISKTENAMTRKVSNPLFIETY